MTAKITLTAVFTTNLDGTFSASFAEIPTAHAQGATMDAAEDALFAALQPALDAQRNETDLVLEGISNVERKEFTFSQV